MSRPDTSGHIYVSFAAGRAAPCAGTLLIWAVDIAFCINMNPREEPAPENHVNYNISAVVSHLGFSAQESRQFLDLTSENSWKFLPPPVMLYYHLGICLLVLTDHIL